jgi:hypothetical protein
MGGQGHTRNMEGDADQLRRAGREARREGKLPSEESATLGASKQRNEVDRGSSHEERIAGAQEGKADADSTDKPRPGNRETDPQRSHE